MKSLSGSGNRFRSSLKDLKIFFGSCLSMHMLPVVFALVLIIVAERKESAVLAGAETPAVEASPVKVPSLKSYVLLNPTNLTQAVGIYKMSRLVLNIIR